MLLLLASTVPKVLAYICVLTFGLYCWFQWTKWDFLQAARRLPCAVKPLPVLGHAHLLLKGWEGFSTYALEAFTMSSVAKGLRNACFWCGPLPIVVIHKAEDIQKILTSSCTAEKGHEYTYVKYATGNGLITAPVHIWKLTRRHITPLFHQHNVEQLMSVFNSNSRELVADLAQHVDKGSVDMLHPAMSVALKTVCHLIFGTELKFDTKSKNFKRTLKAIDTVTLIFCKRIINPLLRIDCLFEFIYKKELKEIRDINKESTKLIKIARKKNANKPIDDSPSGDRFTEYAALKGRLNLIDVYTEFQRRYPEFTDIDLEYEIATLIGAGTDTVSIAIASSLLALGTYQNIQDRLYDEINAVVGPDDDVTVDHIRRMQYLDQVYKETLRWSNVVPYVLRRTTEDLKLSDCTIPTGSTIAVGLIGPHVDAEIYPNPQKFEPENFSAEMTARRTKNSFIPFSSGGRNCPGKHYAGLLTKTTLVHLLRRYRVSTAMDISNLKKKLCTTLVNSQGYLVKITNR